MTFKKIQLVEHRQQQYLADSRQFAKSSAIPTEKQQGIAIIAALEKDVSDFEARVNRFFRHVATSNIQPDISATQINHMTASNLALEDSILRKDEEIGTPFRSYAC